MMDKIEDVILFQIEQASKASKQYSQREFERLGFGITVDQWVLLKIISEASPLSQKELATKSFRDPASITRTLDLLTTKNFIVREPILDNKRAYNICLSKAGEKFIALHMETIRKHRLKSCEGFSEKELVMLSAFLKRIRKNML